MTRNRSLSYANVASTLALVVALSTGGAYAASLATNSVGTAQLKTGAVTTPKLHDNAVTSAKVGANTLTGADINERTLTGVNASSVTGLQVKKINYQRPFGTGTAFETVLEFPGRFRIDAKCEGSGNFFEVLAYIEEANSSISQSAVWSYLADDTNVTKDLGSSNIYGVWGPGSGFAIDDALPPSPYGNVHAIDVTTPSGFVAHINLRLSAGAGAGGGCKATGIAIGG